MEIQKEENLLEKVVIQNSASESYHEFDVRSHKGLVMQILYCQIFFS